MYKDIYKDNQYFGLSNRPSYIIFQTCNGLTFNYLYFPEEGLFDRPKYWLSLYISLYIFGFLFVVWRWFFFTLQSKLVQVHRTRVINLNRHSCTRLQNHLFKKVGGGQFPHPPVATPIDAWSYTFLCWYPPTSYPTPPSLLHLPSPGALSHSSPTLFYFLEINWNNL